MSKRFCKAWIEVKGAVVGALAINDLVRLTNDQLSLTFRADTKNAELSAIAAGLDYVINENIVIKEVLECKPKKRLGILKLSGSSDFTIHDLDSAIAWYLEDASNGEKESKGLTIVKRADLKGEDEIAIATDGRIFVSENVDGKQVKLRADIRLPRQVMHLPGVIKDIKAHLVYEEKNNVKYLGVIGEIIPNINKKGTSIIKERQNIKIKIKERIEDVLLEAKSTHD